MKAKMIRTVVAAAMLFLLPGYPGTVQAGALPVSSPADLPPAGALRWLEGLNVFYMQDQLRASISQAFGSRIGEGVCLAVETLSLPARDDMGRPIQGRAKTHFVARTILQVYPEAAGAIISASYSAGDVNARANLISVSGTLPGGDVTGMLTTALDDRTVFSDQDPEMPGEPLRICDLAYNQLVLRFGVKGVLRTIGPALRTSDRDYHISVLRGRL